MAKTKHCAMCGEPPWYNYDVAGFTSLYCDAHPKNSTSLLRGDAQAEREWNKIQKAITMKAVTRGGA